MRKQKIFTVALITLFFLSTIFIAMPNLIPQAYATGITRISQGGSGYARGASTSSTLTVTLQQAPVTGDLLIATVGIMSGASACSVSSIVESNVNWAPQVTTSNYYAYYGDNEIWAGVVTPGASTTVTITISGTTPYSVADICEYSGLATTGILDASATNAGTSNNPTTGTTGTTLYPNELCVGSITVAGYAQTTPTNSFTLLDGSNPYPYFLSEAYLENITSTTGTYSSGTSTNGQFGWVSCIATFAPAPISFSFNSIASPQVSSYAFSVTISASNSYTGTQPLTCNSGSVTVSPSTVTFSSGTWTGSVTLTSSSTITGVELSIGSYTSNSFTLNAQALTDFTFSAIGGSQNAGVPFTVTITAQDQKGNTLTSYNQSPTLLCNASTVVIYPSAPSFSNGVWTGSVNVISSTNVTNAYLYISGYQGLDNSNTFNINTTAAGLVGYWNLDEGTGSTAYDYSGQTNTGTLQNSPSWITGKYGDALQFNGVSQYVSGTITLTSTSATFSCWINPSQFASSFPHCVSISGDYFTIYLGSNSNNVYMKAFGGGYTGFLGTVTLNTWTLVTATFDGSTLRGYMNGVLTSTISTVTGSFSGSYNFGIGSTSGGGDYFSGGVDDVRLYNVALSSAQVAQLYSNAPFNYYVYTSPATTSDDGVSNLAYTENVTVTGQSTTASYLLNPTTASIYHLDVGMNPILPTTVIPVAANSLMQIVTNPTQVAWNSTSTTTRVYTLTAPITSLTNGATTQLTLYDPDSIEPAQTYSFAVTNFGSPLTNAYLEAINSKGAITELKPLTATVDFAMQQYQSYTLTMISDQGSISETFFAGATTANSFTILSGSLNQTTFNNYPTLAANLQGSTITITYQDPTQTTLWLQGNITHLSGSTVVIDYQFNQTGNTQTLLWNKAQIATEYTVAATADINGTWTPFINTLPINAPSNPWLGIFDFLGKTINTLPQIATGWPISSVQIAELIGAAIILLFLCIGSFRTAGAACIGAWIASGFLIVLGWWGNGPGGLLVSIPTFVISGVVAILVHISEAKDVDKNA